MNHAERCRQEATRDVIFLFQRGEWILHGLPWTTDGEYCHNGDGVQLGDVDERGHWTPRDVATLTNEELAEMMTFHDVPCAEKTWRTERVFLTREEGEAYGKRFDYNYREGWRVYGVPAEGSLAQLLRKT